MDRVAEVVARMAQPVLARCPMGALELGLPLPDSKVMVFPFKPSQSIPDKRVDGWDHGFMQDVADHARTDYRWLHDAWQFLPEFDKTAMYLLGRTMIDSDWVPHTDTTGLADLVRAYSYSVLGAMGSNQRMYTQDMRTTNGVYAATYAPPGLLGLDYFGAGPDVIDQDGEDRGRYLVRMFTMNADMPLPGGGLPYCYMCVGDRQTEVRLQQTASNNNDIESECIGFRMPARFPFDTKRFYRGLAWYDNKEEWAKNGGTPQDLVPQCISIVSDDQEVMGWRPNQPWRHDPEEEIAKIAVGVDEQGRIYLPRTIPDPGKAA